MDLSQLRRLTGTPVLQNITCIHAPAVPQVGVHRLVRSDLPSIAFSQALAELVSELAIHVAPFDAKATFVQHIAPVIGIRLVIIHNCISIQ